MPKMHGPSPPPQKKTTIRFFFLFLTLFMANHLFLHGHVRGNLTVPPHNVTCLTDFNPDYKERKKWCFRCFHVLQLFSSSSRFKELYCQKMHHKLGLPNDAITDMTEELKGAYFPIC